MTGATPVVRGANGSSSRIFGSCIYLKKLYADCIYFKRLYEKYRWRASLSIRGPYGNTQLSIHGPDVHTQKLYANIHFSASDPTTRSADPTLKYKKLYAVCDFRGSGGSRILL